MHVHLNVCMWSMICNLLSSKVCLKLLQSYLIFINILKAKDERQKKKIVKYKMKFIIF